MNILPINGRVAIVDNSLKQAQPLMQELSKRRIPFEYYDGRPENFPDENTDRNDIRVLFLDLNLIDNKVHTAKELYSVLYPSINKIIRKDNFPYILICWTRNDKVYHDIVKKINEDFKENSPIDILKLSKSEYFNFEDKKTPFYEDKIKDLFSKIKACLENHTAFNNLISWENDIHNATNRAITESISIIDSDWDKSANWIFTQWSKAYAGRNYKTYSNVDKLKSSYHTLNSFLFENIEEEISKITGDAKFEEDERGNGLSLLKFNEKLLFSFVGTKSKEPGRIVISKDTLFEFDDILKFSINGEDDELKLRLAGADEKKSIKIKFKYYNEVCENIKKNWDIFKLVINPVCDFSQNKLKRSRIIPGIFIENQYKQLINCKTDALFVSPPFYYSEKKSEYFFILDFRYFTSEKEDEGESCLKLKQQVVAEVLSKLSRHINRQGILFIDE